MKTTTMLRVRDVMSHDFDTVLGRDTIREALNKLKFPENLASLVDKRNDDDEYGIVLLSDIAKKVLSPNRSADRVNIFEVMSKPVLSVHGDMDIRYCARFFSRFGINSAPVIENGIVIGMVNYSHLVTRGLMKIT